jgi:anaerobic magnesium-protoporphyrin IX monomethyl ester cyclase
VLLINPRDEGYYYKLGAFFPPFGLGYISAVLKKKGHEVRIIDMNVENFDYRRSDFRGYDVVGISSDTVRFPLAKDIARVVRSQGVPVVMGGPHPTFDVNNILKNRMADYVVLGEGEETFLNLVESLKIGELHPEINGLAYLKDGKVVVHPATFIKDLDTLPFPNRDGLPLRRYVIKFDGNPATSVITSRGCPFDCEFCSASQFMGRLWRRRSVESSLEEIKFLVKKYGYKSLVFFDDNFTMYPKRVIGISEGILKNDMKISWWAFSRADELIGHEDMVEAMAKSGCKMLFIGFESANETALKEFKKNTTSSSRTGATMAVSGKPLSASPTIQLKTAGS